MPTGSSGRGASELVSSYFVVAYLGLTVPVIGVAVVPANGTLLVVGAW
ncbi:hypothetical protein [Actinomadura rugatobispora]|uniref:Uncharacterized protein n=1 Tax=Actinomadura rugatobispora TaxID=1994 RepID=A0ABW0ZV41_9ACTN|nr:hypothetical protein GCM10010200_034740 [Actinomadura rugatobispora]